MPTYIAFVDLQLVRLSAAIAMLSTYMRRSYFRPSSVQVGTVFRFSRARAGRWGLLNTP
jgi:hypothetical protein